METTRFRGLATPALLHRSGNPFSTAVRPADLASFLRKPDEEPENGCGSVLQHPHRLPLRAESSGDLSLMNSFFKLQSASPLSSLHLGPILRLEIPDLAARRVEGWGNCKRKGVFVTDNPRQYSPTAPCARGPLRHEDNYIRSLPTYKETAAKTPAKRWWQDTQEKLGGDTP